MLCCLLVVALPAIGDSNSSAAKFNRVLDIGDKAPVWENLVGTDGKQHSLSDLKAAQAVIVVFTCNHCPVAKAYDKRIVELHRKLKKRKVEVVAVSVSQLKPDNLDAMKKRAKESKYEFQYLQDLSQKIGKSFGALSTPHVFLLNAERRIAYMGKIDDSMFEDRVTERFLADAVTAVLAGKEPDVAETRPIGCPIDFERP